MIIKLTLPLALLAAPGLAYAQPATDPDKSAEQITCELTGQCAVEAEPAPPQLRDKGKQRGFAIDKRADKDRKKNPGYAGKGPEKKPAITTEKSGKDSTQLAKATAKPTPGKSAAGSSRLAVGFDFGTAKLDAAGLRQAKELLAALKGPKLVGKRIVVSGHTDSVGSREDNLKLSQLRAQTLVDYLTQNGIDPTTLEARGFGFDRPIPGLGPRAAANRRVEIALAAQAAG